MEKSKLDEIRKIAEQKREADILRKKSTDDLMTKLKNDEKEFSSKFLGLQNTVFKPSVTDSAKELVSVGKLEYHSNQTTKDFNDQTKKFVKIKFSPKGISNPILDTYIMFEVLSNKNLVKVTERSKGGNNPTTEILGEFNLEQLDKDKIETLLLNFIKKVVK